MASLTGRARRDSETPFEGDIVVGSKIIDYLSSGLYESPASCLKELVNNSYDADATLVKVLVKPDADYIAIIDDGEGMSRADFERHFKRIAESHKRETDDATQSGRPKIGKIGIGFIAANELCNQMEIFSTKAGSNELLHVVIDFSVMRADPPANRRQGESGEDFVKGDYRGKVTHDAAAAEHYTQIYLKDITQNAQQILAGATPPLPNMRPNSLYGLKPETITSRLAQIPTWSELDAYSRTRVEVSLNVPVPYAANWIRGSGARKLSSLTDRVAELKFAVEYDGTLLAKPIFLGRQASDYLIREVEFTGKNVAASGYIYANHGVIRPTELNGLLVRIRNAAVGDYSRDFWGFPGTTGQLLQRWISSEIYADDRLEDALNIDRRTLRETHLAYVELREWFHRELSSFITEVRSTLYEGPATERRAGRKQAQEQAVSRIAAVATSTISPAAGKAISESVNRVTQSSRKNSPPKTFSAAEVFELAVEIAGDILPKDLATRFIEELSRRMRS